MANPFTYPGAPRWVKVSGVISLGLLLFLLLVLLAGVGGHHGPGRHVSSGHAGGDPRWASLLFFVILVAAGAALNWSRLVALVGRPRQTISQSPRRGLRSSMALTPGIRKLVLTAHVVFSVGSLGAVAVFLALAFAGLASQDAQMVRAAYLAMEFTARFLILPLILASLLIGVVQSLATQWGLFRHYWVLAKLLLTVVTVYVLLQQMDGISHVSGVAAETTLSNTDLLALRRSLSIHAAGGLLVLLLITTLSVYKPQGMTRYGWRKQHEERALSQP